MTLMKNRSLLKVLFVVLAAGLLTSCMGLDETDPSSLSAPQVKTFEVKDNGSLVFELSASVDKSASSRVAECGFYYGKDKNMSDAERLECRMTGGTFSADLTLRDYGETFYVCAYISDGTAAGEILCASKELRIKDIETYVEFGAMETMAGQNEDGLSLRCPCEVKEGVGITKWGVCYGQSKNLDIDDSHVEDKGTADNAIDCIIEGLDKNETYYIRPYVCDGEYVAYGAVTELFVNHYTLEDALELPDETSVQLAGVVVAVSTRGFLISDDAGNILYVYAGKDWVRTVDVKDVVLVKGTMTTYNGNRELTFESVDKTSSVSELPQDSAYQLTADNIGEFASAGRKPCKVTAEGKYVQDGTYYNLTVGADPVCISIAFSTIDLRKYVGANMRVTGYYLYTTTSESKTIVTIMMTDVDVNVDLTMNSGSANSYIVSEPGAYFFPAVKGNSNESVGSVKSVEVLWESFSTDTTPSVGDLVQSVSYSDDYISFKTAATFKEGNAVIAAKDESDKILWSWHIWLTDEPGKCVYANNAGTMMDRNLGATSATPGDVGALGLLYQWGRKDPFLGSSSISNSVEAKSTISWPSPVSSSSCGTIGYAVEHPTTFITYNDSNKDWYYTGSSSTDDTRWQSEKTIYDPCPAGWRVPDGGSNGVWNKAGFDDQSYDSSNEGMLFGSGISSPSTWYPASGCRDWDDGSLGSVRYNGLYWSVTPDGYNAFRFVIVNSGRVSSHSNIRAIGQSVRCLQE